MAKSIKSLTGEFQDYFTDNAFGKLKGEDYNIMPGGVLDNVQNAVWTDNSINMPSRTDLIIPEDGRVHMGDFSMSSKEFKICMKMLHKMAMKEMPEEFI